MTYEIPVPDMDDLYEKYAEASAAAITSRHGAGLLAVYEAGHNAADIEASESGDTVWDKSQPDLVARSSGVADTTKDELTYQSGYADGQSDARTYMSPEPHPFRLTITDGWAVCAQCGFPARHQLHHPSGRAIA